MTKFALRLLRWSALGGLAVCAALAGGCGEDEKAPSGPADGTRLAGTQWALDVAPLGAGDASSVSSWITFERDRVNGNDGCNTFTGSYQADGSKLSFGQLRGTKIACASPADEVSRKVTAAFGRVRAYEQSADTLRLKDGDGATLLTYAAAAHGIEGSWTVLSVLYDDAIRSVVADTVPTAEFSADGTVSGSTGCNRFHGTYTLDGKQLDVGKLAATRKACETKEASDQEAGYLAALESAVRIERAGPELTLLNAKGQMVVTLASK